MEEETLLSAIDKLRGDFEEFKKQFADFAAATLKVGKKQIEERPFSVLMLPSKGSFYTNRNKFLMIGFITYYEENILTSEMMHEASIAMPLILEKVILDPNFDIKEILPCDVQAISMFLRAWSYGNNIEIDVECPHCNKSDKHTIMISKFQSKDLENEPDENGEIMVNTQKYNLPMKIRPRSYFEELDFRRPGEPKQLDNLAFYITEFNGQRDRDQIKLALSRLKIMEARDIRKTIQDSLPGIDATVQYNCPFCEKNTELNFGGNGADFLKLPATFMNNVLEEIFLLTHYGENITVEAVKKMPVGERRWLINRLSEELTKKREAEKKAAASARAQSKSKKR